jgi:hypothetical protein
MTDLSVLLGGIATIAIFSFLVKENSFYRFFEHIFIGIAAGYVPIYSMRNDLWPRVLEPMLGMNIIVFPDGTKSANYDASYLLYLMPLSFGLLYYSIYSKKYSWLAKIVIGFQLGASAGFAFQGFFAAIIPQIVGSFKPLVVFSNGTLDSLASFNNIVFVFTLFVVMAYFFFTFRAQDGVLSSISISGRWMMMICFGAFFGSTVMARLSLLVERLQFLIQDWFQAIFALLI